MKRNNATVHDKSAFIQAIISPMLEGISCHELVEIKWSALIIGTEMYEVRECKHLGHCHCNVPCIVCWFPQGLFLVWICVVQLDGADVHVHLL